MGIWRTTHDRHILISVFATGRAKSVALNARFHLLRTVVANPLIALRAWRRLHEGAIGRFPAIGYFRGLTAGRVGLVLLICTILTVRQVSPCVFQVGCSLPDGRTLSGFLLFLARQFVFALPMLLAVTVADNMTRSRQ